MLKIDEHSMRILKPMAQCKGVVPPESHRGNLRYVDLSFKLDYYRLRPFGSYPFKPSFLVTSQWSRSDSQKTKYQQDHLLRKWPTSIPQVLSSYFCWNYHTSIYIYYVYMYVCMYACMYACMYVYIHIYITHINPQQIWTSGIYFCVFTKSHCVGCAGDLVE